MFYLIVLIAGIVAVILNLTLPVEDEVPTDPNENGTHTDTEVVLHNIERGEGVEKAK